MQTAVFDIDVKDRELAQQVVNALSERELACFLLIGRGCCTKKIAAAFGISYKTASTHRHRARSKLGLDSAEALAVLAWRTNFWLTGGHVIKQVERRPTINRQRVEQA